MNQISRRYKFGALLGLSLMLSACLGLAHVKVDMPPLAITGQLLDETGKPLANETMVVVLAQFYSTRKALAVLTTGRLLEDDGYRFREVRTGPQGLFACRLPGESRYVGFMGPFMAPGQDVLRRFLVGIRSTSGTVVAISVAGSEASVERPVGPDFKLEAIPGDYPMSVAATVARSDELDRLQLVIHMRRDHGRH